MTDSLFPYTRWDDLFRDCERYAEILEITSDEMLKRYKISVYEKMIGEKMPKPPWRSEYGD
jgi:hypothetical protein